MQENKMYCVILPLEDDMEQGKAFLSIYISFAPFFSFAIILLSTISPLQPITLLHFS